MSTDDRYERLSTGLADGVRAKEGLNGLVLLGSASDEARHRRDEWSDHDFFALIEAGRGQEIRPDLSWLPEQERIVLTAREGEIGFVAVYDDGHVFEFAFSEAEELRDAVAGDATIVVDDAEGTLEALIAGARERALRGDGFDPVNDARLVLVKILIGVGRARRGERINGSGFIRTWATQLLVRTIRGLFPLGPMSQRDVNDPTRRFERDYPEWGARIAEALRGSEEEVARALFVLLRELEPGWPEFPSRAADAVARRLGWE